MTERSGSGHELPASVRAALWGTEMLAGRLEPEGLARRALPDVDVCEGLVEQVEVWRALGERVLLAALPRPGDVTGLPKGSAEFVDAATGAQECVFVPGVGGALVPKLSTFGPEGDQGWRARWVVHTADPMPVHRVEAVDLGQAELALRTGLAEVTEELVRAGTPPFGAAAERGLGRARAARDGAVAWGLPEGMPPRAVRVIELAGTVLAMADAGLDTLTGSLSGSLSAAGESARHRVLRGLQSRAAASLTDATNAAALHLAFRT